MHAPPVLGRLWPLSLALAATVAATISAAQPKLDNYGDPLPEGAVLRLGTERLRAHHGFCWMPDGKSLVTVAAERVWFWDIEDGKLLKSLPFGPAEFDCKLAISADGGKLVCGSEEGILVIYDLKTGKQIIRHPPTRIEGNSIRRLALAPDGSSLVTGNYGGIIQLWDVDALTPKERLEAAERHSELPCFGFSHDSRQLAVGTGRKILLFDLAAPAKPMTIEAAHEKSILSVAFTHDNKRLVSTGAGKSEELTTAKGVTYTRSLPELRMWDVAERRLLADLAFPEGMETPGKLALAHDGKTAVTIHRNRSLVWDLKERKVIRTFDGQSNRYGPEVIDVVIDPTGTYVAANCNESYVRVWGLNTGRLYLGPDSRHSGHILSIAWSPDGGTIATGSWDESVGLWDANTGRLVRKLKRATNIVKSVAFSTDSKLVASASHEFDADDLEFQGSLRIFRVADGAMVLEKKMPTRADCLAFSNDATKIAVGIAGSEGEMEGPPELLVLDVQSGEKLAKFGGFARPVVAVGWSADDRKLYVAARDNTLRQVNVAAKVEFSLVNAPHDAEVMGELRPGSLESALFLPHSADAISCDWFPGLIHRWNMDTGKKAWTIEGPTKIRRIALSPDGRLLTAVSTRKGIGEPRASGLTAWEVATRREVLHIDLAGADPYSLAFSPDGRRVVTGFANGSALVWDVSQAWEKLDK